MIKISWLITFVVIIVMTLIRDMTIDEGTALAKRCARKTRRHGVTAAKV